MTTLSYEEIANQLNAENFDYAFPFLVNESNTVEGLYDFALSDDDFAGIFTEESVKYYSNLMLGMS